MDWLTFKIQRAPGFRFNLIDAALILALIAVSVAWSRVDSAQHLYLLPLYLGSSFFLFCNVFRIGNRIEPVWYLTFVALAVYGLSQERFPWPLLLCVCEGVKWALIGWRIRRGPYYGAFHRRLAP